MADLTKISPSLNDMRLVKLAREIAIDIYPLETILKQYLVTPEDWEKLKLNQNFQRLVLSEAEAWNSALNTHERTKLKAAAMMEEWLPELNNRLHDKEVAMPAKVEGGKLLAKIAGMGERALEGSVGGERFTVTINLGEDSKLITIEKQLPPRVIEHEPSE